MDRGDTKTANALRHIISAEKKQTTFAKLCRLRQEQKEGLQTIRAPSDPDITDYTACRDWISIYTPL